MFAHHIETSSLLFEWMCKMCNVHPATMNRCHLFSEHYDDNMLLNSQSVQK